MLPPDFAWLEYEPGPKMLREALACYGVKETPGPGDNPVLLSWAREIGCSWYVDDATPWCGLGMAVWAKRAGWDLPKEPLRAASWREWGNPVDLVRDRPSLGDVGVKARKGGNHVFIYVGEDSSRFYGLGANQGDAVSIAPVSKVQVDTWRRAPWRSAQPANVRALLVGGRGLASVSEA
jgi:uncharacterized protein (TIGR02594 family)